jgi:glycerol-3-phosphate dehydrogenase
MTSANSYFPTGDARSNEQNHGKPIERIFMNTPTTRQEIIATLQQQQTWDLIIIGGGATGLGTALEAASRGYKTLLLEQYDFAKGTSSRSTKLVHGGVRYLAQGNLKLVRSALRERGLLRRNAPHLVHDLTFFVPAYAWWSKFYYGAGLKLYDILAGSLNLAPSRFLSKEEARSRMPTVRADGLTGGILYHDGQFDDARLAITLLRTFLDQGGIALNYCKVTRLIKENDRVVGVQALADQTPFNLRAKAVVNATGIFVDAIRHMDDPTQPKLLSPSQGIHLVVDKRFQPSESAMMIPKTADGRVLFAVPWHNKVVLGTTDTAVDEVAIEPRPLATEIEFILQTMAQYLVNPPTRADVLSVFVGQRPLLKSAKFTRNSDGVGSTATLSREHVIQVSWSGLVTVTGGKWTTYRQMGEQVVARAIASASLPATTSVTANLHLHGWTEQSFPEPLNIYGSDAIELQTLPGAARLLHPNLPYSEAEVRWAARSEMAQTVEDVLARRTRSLLLDAAASMECAPRVAQILAEELDRDSNWAQQQVQDFTTLAQGYQLDTQSARLLATVQE